MHALEAVGFNTVWVCCRVFYKQRNNKFFPVSTYAYAMAFSHVSSRLAWHAFRSGNSEQHASKCMTLALIWHDSCQWLSRYCATRKLMRGHELWLHGSLKVDEAIYAWEASLRLQCDPMTPRVQLLCYLYMLALSS